MNKTYKILIISGGYFDCEWAAQWLKQMDIFYCIAADRGLMYVDKLGIDVDCILGDYDSVDKKALDKYKDNEGHVSQQNSLSKNMNIITFPTEKDYTDTHLAIKKAINVIKEQKELKNKTLLNEIEAKENSFEIYILGGIGTRLDHTMTNIYCMNEAHEAGIDCYMIDKYNKIYICDKQRKIVKKEQHGAFVSIVPVTEEVILTLKGMKYNLNHFCLKQGVSICQSNEIADETAQIIVEKGKIIVYETRD